ncbi:MAG: uncharacterized protein JWM05_8 [Acidimicrobiales bacterium]|nr:uncharacterized protein [Acidimicrobiales bacterium]
MESATRAPRLAEIWRHPVKSLQGERLDAGDIEADGLRGDRCWGIRDEATGRILTGRREPQLLQASAVLRDDGEADILLPDGRVLGGAGAATDAALSTWLGRPVSLVGSVHEPGAHAEFFADATDDSSAAIEWTMPAGRFVDALPLLVLTTASLRAGAALHPSGEWDVRRFRPNLLVEHLDDGWVEDAWCGQTLSIGSARLQPLRRCERCTMVTRPQPGLDRDLDIYKTVAHHHDRTLGVWTAVLAAGTVHTDDPVDVH